MSTGEVLARGLLESNLDVIFSGVGARLPGIVGVHLDLVVSGVGASLPDVPGGLRTTPRVGCGRVHPLLSHNVVFETSPSEDGVVPAPHEALLLRGCLRVLPVVVLHRLLLFSWLLLLLRLPV